MRKITGYILTAGGLLSCWFFDSCNGSLIPYPMLWYYASLAIFGFGMYVIITSQLRKNKKQEKYNQERLSKLKHSGEKIVMSIDNCEVRENNYYEEVERGNWRAQQVDADFSPNTNYKQNYIEQSAIIYYDKSNNNNRLTSQTFPCTAEKLRYYMEEGKVILYISRFNKNDYAFEVEERCIPGIC